jgi:hypothetical protein
VILALSFLSGCMQQHAQEIKDARELRERKSAECRKQFPDPYKKPAVSLISCFAAANQADAEAHDRIRQPPIADLVRATSAQILEIAERYDKGKLTQAQYEAEKSRAEADLNSRILQRSQGHAVAMAAEDQAGSAAAIAANSSRPRSCSYGGGVAFCY